MNKENQIQQIADEAIKKIQAIRDAGEEKEYRAGEWVPKLWSTYWLNDHDGTTFYSKNSNHRFDKYRIKSGNAFPRKPIAEAAKAHADWWREFDMIADAPLQYTNDKGMYEVHRSGRFSSWAITFRPPEIILHPQEVERLGGELKVIDMLTCGRVFRFKWGGQ